MKVLVNGCNGKMGQVVTHEVKVAQDMDVVCGVDRVDAGDNAFPVFTKVSEIDIMPDVIIDFSIPEARFKIAEWAEKNHVPTVIATTGFSDNEMKKIEKYAEKFPIFKSANMSYEINLMAKVIRELALKLDNSDIEIVETHHNRKIDAPSGTALLLADSMNEALNGEMNYEYNRHSKREKRTKKEIGIHSIRGGTEVGKHSVIFFGENESLEITHNCTSRNVFARGAIKAAEFILHKENGLYSMNDRV